MASCRHRELLEECNWRELRWKSSPGKGREKRWKGSHRLFHDSQQLHPQEGWENGWKRSDRRSQHFPHLRPQEGGGERLEEERPAFAGLSAALRSVGWRERREEAARALSGLSGALRLGSGGVSDLLAFRLSCSGPIVTDARWLGIANKCAYTELVRCVDTWVWMLIGYELRVCKETFAACLYLLEDTEEDTREQGTFYLFIPTIYTALDFRDNTALGKRLKGLIHIETKVRRFCQTFVCLAP